MRNLSEVIDALTKTPGSSRILGKMPTTPVLVRVGEGKALPIKTIGIVADGSVVIVLENGLERKLD